MRGSRKVSGACDIERRSGGVVDGGGRGRDGHGAGFLSFRSSAGQGFRPGPLGDRGFGQLAYDKGLRIFAATQPEKVARGTAVQGPATLLIEALNTAATPTASQGISAWLQAAERMLPQRARQLYPALNEDDLQWPELMDFRRERTAPPRL